MSKLVNQAYLFHNRILILGFGSIGRAILPLIFKHLSISPNQITIVSKSDDGKKIAEHFGIQLKINKISKQNYAEILKKELSEGDFLLNLSVDISSIDLIKWCRQHHVLYLDTCIELWGTSFDHVFDLSRSNYVLREQLLALKTSRENEFPTTIVTHGANPGLVSHFVKEALLNLTKDNDVEVHEPLNQVNWAKLAEKLSIKVIHISERDTQIAAKKKQPGEFVNTWSIDGFVVEGGQVSELGWGTHEKYWPKDACRYPFGCRSGIYLLRPGVGTRVRTWTPIAGSFHGFLITHTESISIANYLTIKKNDEVIYRPTVHYAYHPCDDAILSMHELVCREWRQQEVQRLLSEEIIDGCDELGVLLMGNSRGVYWFGSQLSIHEARSLVPYNNATTLQVAIGALSGMLYAICYPNQGILEPDEMDHQFIMSIAKPYLGRVNGYYTDWNPLKNRKLRFNETIDQNDPWQFVNIRV